MATRLVLLLALFFLVASFVSFASAGAGPGSGSAVASLPGLFDAVVIDVAPPGDAAPGDAAAAQDDSVTARPVIYRGETEFPDDTALIIETGCWGCDGPTSALYRVSRSSGGPVHVDKLFGVEPGASGRYITGFAMKPDASEMVVSVCTRLYCGGLGNVEPGSEITVYYSRDGGAGWQEIGVSRHYFDPVALTDEGIVFVMTREGQPLSYYLNSGVRVVPPDEAVSIQYGSQRNGALSWSDEGGRALNGDGSSLLSPPGADYLHAVAQNPGQPLLASWRSGDERRYLSTLAADGSLLSLALQPNGYALPAAWLDGEFVIATVETYNLMQARRSAGLTPAMVNMATGEVWTIAGFDTPPFGRPIADGPASTFLTHGRNRVQAVLRGPFLRVAGPECAPVRHVAIGGGLLDCAAATALLRPTGRQDRGWLQVILADGRQGWVDGRLVGW